MSNLKFWTNRFIQLISVLGILLSAYLWWIQVTPNLAPCIDGGGCEDVLSSDFGKIFGVPMAVYGFFYYAGLLLLAFQRSFVKHKLLDWLLLIGIVWGVIFSLYLRYLEFAKIGHICVWCWISFGFTLILMGIIIFEFVKMKKKP